MSMALMTGHGEYGAVILKVFHFHQQFSKKNGFDSEEPQKSYIKYLGGLQGNLCRYFYIERRSYGWVVFIKVEGLSDSVMIRQIKYVHEFQHILWAMGFDAGFEI